jgi:hypothetical protein
MSFCIDWDKVKTSCPPSELTHFLNDKFKQANKPEFIGNIQVTNLDLGSIPPHIEILQVCDPIDDFYDNDLGDNTSLMEPSVDTASASDCSILKDENHAQLEISIKYNGNLRATINTSLIINQPTLNFMVLPVTLMVTGCSFDATAIVAYMGVGSINSRNTLIYVSRTLAKGMSILC